MSEAIDYTAILADLEAKKAAIEQAIASIRSAIAIGAAGLLGDPAAIGSTAGTPSTPPGTITFTGEIPEGAFHGKSIPEAAKIYLSIVRKKQTSAQIAEALLKYGMETQSKNFPKIVHAVMDRVRQSPNGGLVKLDKSQFGLAEWYHPSFRTKIEEKKPSKKASKAKKARRPNPTIKAKAEGEASAEAGKVSVPQRIAELLKSKAGAEVSSQEIATSLGIKTNVATLLLGSLIAKKRAEKTASGKYRAMAA